MVWDIRWWLIMQSMKKLNIEPLKVDGFSDAENRASEDYIESLLKEWENTPYMSGKCVKKRGVDCVHFISAIYDALLGVEHVYEPLPQDMSFHDKEKAEAGLRRMFRFYPCSGVEGDTIQPGDIVICGPIGKQGGPGHGMIAGKNSLWHVDSIGVCRSGLCVTQAGTSAFKQIRRLDDRTVYRDALKRAGITVEGYV